MTRKRSASVILTLGITLSSCSRTAPDPCEADSFNQQECPTAIQQHGYYSRGTFIPHSYPFGYPFYYSRYGSFLAGGGRVRSAPSESYSHSSRSSIVRGGFGSTAHGSGGE